MRLLCLISVLAIISPQVGNTMSSELAKEVPKDVKVFWIPPEIETYTPVTPENIEKAAFKIVDIKSKKQAAALVALIQESDQTVDRNRIRVKVSTGDKFYNFDSNGTGISSAGRPVRIDLKRLKLVLCE